MKRALILYVLFVCLAGLLGACGGGGGGNTSPAQLSLSIDLTSLPAATVNMTYNQTVAMTTSGGTAPYLYSCSVTNGAGLSASVSSSAPTKGGALCVISGTPLNAGAVTLNFSVSDSTKASASAGPLSVNISPSADPLDNWHLRNPLPQGNTLRGVTYGNGIFVAAGDNGTILTSPDGVEWQSSNPELIDSLNGVTYGNGIFVAVGDNGTILTSPDGVAWKSSNPGIIGSLNGVTYGNGIFMAVGDGTILTSPDGVTWTDRNLPVEFYTSVTYGNGTFVVVGYAQNAEYILTSPDGVTWPSEYRSTGVVARSVTFGNGTFVTVGDTGLTPENDGAVITSPDGLAWASSIPGIIGSLYGVTYGNGAFVAVGYGGAILTSPDNGVTWISRNSGITGYLLRSVTYGNGTFVAVGDNGTILQSDSMK